MLRHPLLTAGTPAGLVGLAWVVIGVMAQGDLDLGSILIQAGLLGLAVFTIALVVLWVIEAYTRPRD